MVLRVRCDGCGKDGQADEIPRDFERDQDLCPACLNKHKLDDLQTQRSSLMGTHARIGQEIDKVDVMIKDLTDGVQH